MEFAVPREVWLGGLFEGGGGRGFFGVRVD